MADLPAGVSEVEVEVETMCEPQHEVQIETQPMIALQPLTEPEREEVVVQTTEEVIEESKDTIVEVSVPTSPPAKQRKGRGSKNRSHGRSSKGQSNNTTSISANSSNKARGAGISDSERTGTRKWEQKQVQIKTLEGEFAVAMWASGTFNETGCPLLKIKFDFERFLPVQPLQTSSFVLFTCLPLRLLELMAANRGEKTTSRRT